MRTLAIAEKIKWTYIAQLDTCLGGISSAERTEMIQSIIEHIDEFAFEQNVEVIDERLMEEFLSKMGAPEEIAESLKDGKFEKVKQPEKYVAPGQVSSSGSAVWFYVGMKHLLAGSLGVAIVLCFALILGTEMSLNLFIGGYCGTASTMIFLAARDGYQKGDRKMNMRSIKDDFWNELFSFKF